MIFLAQQFRSKKAKQYILMFCLALFILEGYTQTGVINNGAKMIVNTGAVLKVIGTGADYTNEDTLGLNGRIDLDGKIIIEGDWINNTSSEVFINTNNDGLVLFNGSTEQNISGDAVSLFENLTLDNSSGLSISSDVGVKYVFTLTNGLVTLNTNDVIIGTGGSIAGSFGPTKMFVVNSTGGIRKLIGGTGAFTFPIGENTGTPEYSPVTFNLTSHSGVSSAWVVAQVNNSKHPNNTSPSEYINRYWTLTSSGITSPKYNTNYYYQQADVLGTENLIYSAEYDGANRTVYSTVDATNNILSFTGLSSFADYTGVDGTVPTVSVTSSEDPGPTNVGPVPFTVVFSEEVTGFDNSDISVDNGTPSAVSTSDDKSFDFTVIPDKDSTVTINIGSAVAKDIAGNDNSAATAYRIVYDSTNPTVDISGPTAPQNTDFDITVEFSEEITGFVSGDVSVTNGSVSNFVEQIEGFEYIVTISPSVTDDIVDVDVIAGVAQDLAGNDNEAATQFSVRYDDVPPGVTFSGPASPTNLKPFTLTIEFDEGVTDFDLADLSKTNCNIAGFTEVTEDTLYTVTVTPSITYGTVTVDIASGQIHDYAGNANSDVTDYTVTYDGIAPGVGIVAGVADPTNSSPFGITITFDEEVNNFHVEDISVTNGSADNFSTLDSTEFTADITPTASGLVIIDVLANVASDNAGNNNTAGQLSITFDEDDPLLSSTYPVDNAMDVALTDNLQMIFNEKVYQGSGTIYIRHTSDNTVFQSFDVSALNGYGTKTITINPNDFTSQIEYYVTIPVGAFEDEAGNAYGGISSTTAWSFTTVDENVPVISTLLPADETEDVSVTANLVITFNEDVTAIAGKYIKIVNETTSDIESIEATNTSFVDVTNNVVTIDPTDFDGETTYHVLLDAGAFEDGDNNPFGGISSTSYWNFTSEDIAPPTVDGFSPSNGAIDVAYNANLEITFSENVVAGVGNINIRDVATSSSHYLVGAGSLSITDNVVTIDPPDFSGETEYYVEIDPDAFKDGSDNYYAGISGSGNWNFTIEDITDPTVFIAAGVTSPTNSSPFGITITFSEEMEDFGLGAISVQNGSASIPITSDSIIFTSNITPSAEGYVEIEIPQGAAMDEAGNSNEASNVVTVSYDITEPTVEISSTEADPTASSFDITIDFSEGITGLITNNITVDNGTASNLVGSTNGASWDATITPTTDGTVTVEIMAGEVTDTAGNGNIASSQFTIEYDATGPKVIAKDPSDGELDVPFDTDLQITFDENVNLNGGYFLHIFESGVGEVESFDVTTLSGDGTSVITVNSSDFNSESTYYIEIDPQAFTDDLGNGYTGMSSGEWEFTIEDKINPTVDGLYPINGSSNVPVDTNLIITFSEPVQKSVGTIIIVDADDQEHETIIVEGEKVTVDGNVVTINPDNDFTGETSYYVTVGESTFQDISSNHNNFGGITSSEWTFATTDTEPPTIIDGGLSPEDDATDVALNTNLILTFSEDVKIGSDNIVIMDDQGIYETVPVGSANLSVSGNQVTINPTKDLKGLTNYYILIDATAFDDLFDNSFAGISNADTWNFSTVDASAPVVSGYSPENNATGLTTTFDLVLTFDEQVQKGSGNITITNSTTTSTHETIAVSSGSVVVNNNMVTITPGVEFIDMNDYYVQISSGAFEDMEGNPYSGILDEVTWKFKIGDNTAPSIVNLTPENSATNVSVTSNLEIEFDENILVGSGNIVIKNLSDGSTHLTIDVSSVEKTANIVTIDPSVNFDETSEYYILIDKGAFTDDSGNEFAGISNNSTWRFSIGDYTSPAILSLSPENNATEVDISTNLQIIFSEPVIANSGLINIMNSTGIQESIDVTSDKVSIVSDTVKVNPGFTLDGETNYYVLMDNGAFHDLSGNSFDGITDESVWKFTTEDITQPTVSITSNVSGTVEDDFMVTITFSEEVIGFEESDIEVTNATLSAFTNKTNGIEWTVMVEPITDGDVTVDISASVAQDAAGNENTAADQFKVTFDSGSGVGIEDVIPFEISAYSSGHKVIVEFKNDDNYKFEEGKIQIYNILGQKIAEDDIHKLQRFEIEVDHVSHIYVVKVILDGSEYKKQLYVE